MKSLFERAEILARHLAESNLHTHQSAHAFPAEAASSAGRLAHGEQVASVLQEWGAGPQLQSAGLLHSLLWHHADSSNRALENYAFDNQADELDDAHVIFLCQEYQRIVEKQPENDTQRDPLSLTLVNYLTLGYQDLGLALLGAADLWCHYQLAKSGDADQRARYHQVASQVLYPYLRFLGMAELASQLRSELDSKSAGANAEDRTNDAIFAYVQGLVDTHLPDVQLHPEPIGRRLGPQSHQWIGKDASPAAEPPSTVGSESSRHFGLVVESEAACFQTLYRLHQFFIPVAGAVRESITHCRHNGYRAIQTTVLHEALPIHFEICTQPMDAINRWGLAAVLRHDEASIEHLDTATASAGSHSEALSTAWWNNTHGRSDRIESAHIGTLSEILFVFSLDGKLHEFHRGATVVDYAYSIDPKRAPQCRRFFVNGEAVEPATVLHHLDLVDLEIDPSAPGPTRIWLNAASTAVARSAIDHHLKRHGEGISHAQQLLDERRQELEQHYGFHMSEERVNHGLAQEVKQRNLPSKENLLAEISAGRLHTDRILHPLFATEILRQIEMPPGIPLRPHQLTLAECCRPKLGEEVVGIPQIHEGTIAHLEIHGATCPLAARPLAVSPAAGSQTAPAAAEAQPPPSAGRSVNALLSAEVYPIGPASTAPIPIHWRLRPDSRTVAQIELRALDEERLLADAVNQIHAAAEDVVLHRSAFSTRNGSATARFVVEAPSAEVIDTIADSLRQLPNRTVDDVYQIDLPLSEQKELAQTDSVAQVNPYTRMPVYEEGMFFGRTRELNEMRDWLRGQVGIIWLVGQKRVGKTSLLLHLKNHILDRAEFTPIYLDFQIFHSLAPIDLYFEIASTVYVELQSEGHNTELGPPLRSMFEYDPVGNLIRYLKSAQSNPQVGKLVLLMDEFSRTTDAHQSGDLDEQFFMQWRGLVQMTQPGVKFIIVVQQQAINQMDKRSDDLHADPSWQLMELGEIQNLRPLSEKDARNLIEWPIRNYMQATPELLDRIHALTGSSPFLIQSFCFKLVSHMMQFNKRTLEWSDLDVVRMELLAPTESIFAHLLDMIQGNTSAMCTLVAKIADQELQRNSRATPLVSWQQIAGTYPVFLSNRLRHSLNELCERHILIAVGRQGMESWRFSSILFQEWLALNVDDESKPGGF